MSHPLLNSLPLVVACLLISASPIAAAEFRPNILVVLCDDLGYGDLACYGHPKIKTPHLDRFASESLKLTSCYSAAPNCSPARTGLMTGRTPFRVGVHNWIPMLSPMHVRDSEITIATLLKEAGYNTCHVGKWHLNGRFNLPEQPQPCDHGFQHWFSTQNNALPNHRNPVNFVRNGTAVGPLKGYAAHLVTDEAIRWLTDLRDDRKPFFMYCCYHEPHEPIWSDAKYRKLYGDINTTLANHHGNVTQMDAAFGRLLATLDELKLRKDTFIFFTSDNGPAITNRHPHGSSGPLRDKKGYLYDGGIRVPGIVHWPGQTKPGSVSDTPVSGVDVLPTLCELAGIQPPHDRKLDGESFLPVLKGKPIERSTPLYWQFNASRGKPKVAIRDGDWKMLATLTGPEVKPGADIHESEQRAIKAAELKSFELYNLKDDVAEKQELTAEHAERFATMKKQLVAKYREVRDESPTWPAWEWPRYEGKRIEWFPRDKDRKQR